MLAAFAYVAGYVATNVLTERARRTDDVSFRREALRFSTRFENLALLLIIVLMVLRRRRRPRSGRVQKYQDHSLGGCYCPRRTRGPR